MFGSYVGDRRTVDHFACQKAKTFCPQRHKHIMVTENSKANEVLAKVPVDIFLRVLEYISEKLLEEVQNVQVSDSITQYLDQYAQLNLVCRSFHQLLTHYVGVDGVLLRVKLAEAQIRHFKTLLISYADLQWRSENSCTRRTFNPLGTAEIMRSCGCLWRNPLFPGFLPSIFVYHKALSAEALAGTVYLWQKLNETFG